MAVSPYETTILVRASAARNDYEGTLAAAYRARRPITWTI